MIEELHTDLQDSPTVDFLRALPKHRGKALYLCETLNRGLSFIKLPQRQFVVWDNHEVITYTRARPDSPRLIGHSLEPKWTQLRTNLSRELVIIILGRKDIAFLDDNRLILYLRDAVLRVAGNQQKRKYLHDFLQKNAEFVRKIENYDTMTDFARTEIEAQSIYERLTKLLQIRHYEGRIIKLLSWEWKPQFSLYPYSCRMWILIMCFCRLIQTDR